jgi:hypothetical protein
MGQGPTSLHCAERQLPRREQSCGQAQNALEAADRPDQPSGENAIPISARPVRRDQVPAARAQETQGLRTSSIPAVNIAQSTVYA